MPQLTKQTRLEPSLGSLVHSVSGKIITLQSMSLPMICTSSVTSAIEDRRALDSRRRSVSWASITCGSQKRDTEHEGKHTNKRRSTTCFVYEIEKLSEVMIAVPRSDSTGLALAFDKAGAASCNRKGKDSRRSVCCGAGTQVQRVMCRIAQVSGVSHRAFTHSINAQPNRCIFISDSERVK